jgi:hypothetical protein
MLLLQHVGNRRSRESLSFFSSRVFGSSARLAGMETKLIQVIFRKPVVNALVHVEHTIKFRI